jgi:ribosomal-protein-alanine N-acetyltransferase
VKFDDIGAITALEKECFPSERYPCFFFVQAQEIFANTFLLAEDETRQPIGYILGVSSSKDPSKSWILSMSVTPAKRRNGVGSALLQAAQVALSSSGATKLFLSVAEDNPEAISLYRKFGFNKERTERIYFGKTQPRLIMSKTLHRNSSITQSILDPSNLLSEASTGVSFSSVLLALSAAVLALLTPRPDIGGFTVPVLLLCLTIFSSFYAVLFYANTSGSLSRIYDVASATKPLQYGNSISEYLGVFPIICAFPLIVWGVTKNLTITIIACTIDILGFVFYQLSGFDLLSRVIASRIIHFIATICLALLVALTLVFAIRGHAVAHYITVGVFLAVCIWLCIISIKGNERKHNKVNPADR